MLQGRYGIGYQEAYHVRPAWEIDNLLAQHRVTEKAEREALERLAS